jgi:hypothetical protein
MNRKAYYAGQKAASSHYCLTGLLLDMNAEEQAAIAERDRCWLDHEIWYWNGVIDFVREFQAMKQKIQQAREDRA